MLRTTRVALLSRRGFHNFAGSIVPTKSGLYDPAHEKDSCGVGFVVDIKGLKTHSTVTQALQASGAVASSAPPGARACGLRAAPRRDSPSPHFFSPRRRWRTWTTAAPWARMG